MMTERELLKAISDCEAEPITQNKISMLADLYIIYDHLFGHQEKESHSYSQAITDRIYTDKTTDFLSLIDGKETTAAISAIAEFVEAVKALHPKMYERLAQTLGEI